MCLVPFPRAISYDTLPVPRVGAISGAAIRVRFVVDKCHTYGILEMKTYSISEAAQILGIDRKTLYRWIRNRSIPAPKPGVVDGRLARVWIDEELATIKKHMIESYWGKGIDRRTGQKAKQKQS